MKKSSLLLFALPFLLVACRKMEDAPTGILLIDGTRQEIGEEMSDSEYEALLSKLSRVTESYDYKFIMNKIGGENINKTIDGLFSECSITEGRIEYTYQLNIAKYQKSEWTGFTNYETNYENLDQWMTLGDYILYDDELECGSMGVYHSYLDESGERVSESQMYLNPDLPSRYPQESENMKTKSDEYIAMQRFGTFRNATIFKTGTPFFKDNDKPVYIFNEEEFYLPVTHTHELTSQYLIIHEYCRGVPYVSPVGTISTQYVYWSTLTNKLNNYHFNKSFYYNLKTGLLDKEEYDYCTVDPYIKPNTVMAGKCELTYRHDMPSQIKKMVFSKIDEFICIPGVFEQ